MGMKTMKSLAILFTGLALCENVLGAAPQFSNPASGSGTVSIPEGGPRRAVYNVTAKSAANYTLVGQTPATPVLFAVAANGIVTTSADIDYETIKTKKFILKINAISGADTATATLNVTITDVNDNTPQFSPAAICATIPSNATAGTTVGTYTATDADNTGTLTYSITTGDDTEKKFSMDAHSGVLTTTKQAFNKTEKAIYSLVINASDGNNTGTARLNVTLDGSCAGNKIKKSQDSGNNGTTIQFYTLFAVCLFLLLQIM